MCKIVPPTLSPAVSLKFNAQRSIMHHRRLSSFNIECVLKFTSRTQYNNAWSASLSIPTANDNYIHTFPPYQWYHIINNRDTKQQLSQHRHFSSRGGMIKPKIKAPCPYRTLNISKDATYAQAKKNFLKIAMKHHPDTVGNDCEETRQKSQNIFMKCRAALESFVEYDDTGKCILKSDKVEEEKSRMSNEEFDDWFKEETGHNNPFQFDLDPSVMREVADTMTDMEGSHGLDRDGGMWHLASMISSAVKSGKEGAESVLKLEAGNVRPEDVEAKGKLERRRKRTRGRR